MEMRLTLQKTLTVAQMDLIQLNPEGLNGAHEPVAATKDLLESSGNRAMHDDRDRSLEMSILSAA